MFTKCCLIRIFLMFFIMIRFQLWILRERQQKSLVHTSLYQGYLLLIWLIDVSICHVVNVVIVGFYILKLFFPPFSACSNCKLLWAATSEEWGVKAHFFINTVYTYVWGGGGTTFPLQIYLFFSTYLLSNHCISTVFILHFGLQIQWLTGCPHHSTSCRRFLPQVFLMWS